MPTGDLGHPGESPEARAARIVPGGNAEELAERYLDDQEVQDALQDTEFLRALATIAFVAAEKSFGHLRDLVVARTPVTMRHAASPEPTNVGDALQAPLEPQGE